MIIAKFHFKRSFNLRFQNTLKTYTSSFFFPLVLAIHLNALDALNVQQPPKRDVAKFETIRSSLSSFIVQTPSRLHFELPSCPLTCYYPGPTSVFQRELLWPDIAWPLTQRGMLGILLIQFTSSEGFVGLVSGPI